MQISCLPENHPVVPVLLLQAAIALHSRGQENDDREDFEFALCQLEHAIELANQGLHIPELLAKLHEMIGYVIETKYQNYKSFWELNSYRKIEDQDLLFQELTKDICRLSEALNVATFSEFWKFQGFLGILVYSHNKMRCRSDDEHATKLEMSILLTKNSLQSYAKADYLYPYIASFFVRARLDQLDGHEDTRIGLEVANELQEIAPFLTDNIQLLISSARNDHRFSEGDAFYSQYQETDNLQYLKSAIDSYNSLDVSADDDAQEAAKQNRISQCLRIRHRVSSSDEDLEKAVELARNVTTMDINPAQRAQFLLDLAEALTNQYQRTGELGLIEESIELLETARRLYEQYKFNSTHVLRNLGNLFHVLYMRKGRQEDLDQSLVILEEATAMDGTDDLKNAITGEIAAVLFTAYQLKNDIATLDQAIQKGEEAAHSPHADSGMFLSMLSDYYQARYYRLQEVGDLERLVDYAEKALAFTPKTHMKRPGLLNAVCQAFNSRYRRFRQPKDSSYAEEAIREAIELTPKELLPSMEYYAVLGNTLKTRYQVTKDIRHLDAAIEAFEERYKTHTNLDWYKSMFLGNLARVYALRAAATGNKGDSDAFKKHMLEAVQFEESPPALRLEFAHNAVTADLPEPDLAWKDKIVRLGLELLELACASDLPHNDQQHIIRTSAGLAAYGCSLSLEYGKADEALERIEHGRGMILGRLIDKNDDLAALRKHHPSLATEYDDLRQQAFETNIMSRKASGEPSLSRRRGAFSALQRCEDKIRKMESFEWFHRGFPAAELRKNAEQGPIIIVNVTDIRSDALIVTRDAVTCVPLPGMDMTTTTLIRYSLEMPISVEDLLLNLDRSVEPECSTLGICGGLYLLWDRCVSPVLEHLGFRSVADNLPRVWWIGSGAANGLPFHAAGWYEENANTDLPNSCLDCITSSYTPTIKALQYARLGAENVNLTKRTSLAFISMSTTPGHIDLPGVRTEKEAVKRAIDSCYDFTALEQPTAQQVLEQSQQAQLVHFACHGFADQVNPSQSHLLLQKRSPGGNLETDPLTVEALLDVKGQGNSWIVYLSACATAKARVQELGDESLHLATAFQVAGFPHAIGSLWSADDGTCAEVSQYFYQQLASLGLANKSVSVSEILHRAVQKVRSQHPHDPALWAPFVHYGI